MYLNGKNLKNLKDNLHSIADIYMHKQINNYAGIQDVPVLTNGVNNFLDLF